jgi:hypothetical protein
MAGAKTCSAVCPNEFMDIWCQQQKYLQSSSEVLNGLKLFLG